MASNAKIALVVVAALAWPVAAHQDLESDLDTSPPGLGWAASYQRIAAGRTRVDFYAEATGVEGEARYVARRVIRTSGGEAQVSWARSESCLYLTDVLVSLDALAMPQSDVIRRPKLPIGTFPPRPGMNMHGGDAAEIMWNARGPDSLPARMTVYSRDGFYVQFIDYAERVLADCWQPSR